jgi:hypothetical protein
MSKGFCQEKHGAYGIHARRKYSDLRSREGKHLKAIMDGIVSDLGGKDKLNSGQCLILDGLRSKIIIVQQIARYIDEQKTSLVNKQGELSSSILRSDFNMYSESIRRDLETLYIMRRRVKHSTYEKAIESLQRGKGGGV